MFDIYCEKFVEVIFFFKFNIEYPRPFIIQILLMINVAQLNIKSLQNCRGICTCMSLMSTVPVITSIYIKTCKSNKITDSSYRITEL